MRSVEREEEERAFGLLKGDVQEDQSEPVRKERTNVFRACRPLEKIMYSPLETKFHTRQDFFQTFFILGPKPTNSLKVQGNI